MDEHTLYIETSITSAVVCILCALLLLRKNRWLLRIRGWSDRAVPRRYVAARSALAIAYLVIALMTIVGLVLDLPDEFDMFLPLQGLDISSSQAMLFTAAMLSLYDSNLLRYEIITGNILPFFMLLMLHEIAFQEDDACLKLIVRYVWFGLYVIQLIVYTLFFYRERWKYLHLDERVCGESFESRQRHDKGINILFLSSLFVGILALSSYFFTAEWQMAAFIILYTAYYFAVTVYFLRYETRYGESWIRKKLRNRK